MNRLYFLLIVLLLNFNLFSQEISISNENITTCSGFLVDTGLSGGQYSPNENFTQTICAEEPENIINLNFLIFNLGTGDSLSIFDGNTITSPIIGTYTGSELQGMDITSNTNCLTIQWISDATDEGDFSISLTCGVPCIAPIVSINSETGSPELGCPDEEIIFDGSLTQFFNGGLPANFTWDFGDGTTDTISWPIASHTYTEPGGYLVELYMTDSNGCSSTNFVSFVVLIATEPSINIEIDSPICLGSEANYDIEASYEPVTWTQITSSIEGGDIFIPDDQTQVFSNSIPISLFNPDEIIDEVSDFNYFFVNMEHSFMGDLIIQFECPNGQSIVVHQQEGGGTFLGIPVDNDALPNNPGTGFDYYWTPTATNGTWAEEATNVATLPSGEYQSVSPWSNLIGCPLNGIWTITIADNWGSDNGFIFDWSLAFNPDLYPELYNFTPEIGNGPDSTFWNIDPTITNITDDGNGLTLLFEEPGVYQYTYTLIDNFGCTYNEDYEIEVIQGPIADAGEDIFLCNEDGNLNGQIIPGNTPFNSAVYEWTPYNNLSDATMNLSPSVTNLDTTTTYVLSVYPTGNEQCVSNDSITVTILDIPNPGEDTELIYCPTDNEISLFNELNGNPDQNGNWLDQWGAEIDSIFDPATDSSTIIHYAFPECSVYSEISILINDLNFEISSDTIICENGEATLEVELLNTFEGEANYIWSQGLPNADVVTVSPENPTIYTVHIEYGNGCYTNPQMTNVILHAPLSVETTPSTTICPGIEFTIGVQNPTGGRPPYIYSWTDDSETIISTEEFFEISLQEANTYCVTMSDQCESSIISSCTDITVEQPYNPSFTQENNTGCYPVNPLFTPVATNYDNIQEDIWTYGDGTQNSNLTGILTHQYTSPGDYTITHTIISSLGCFYTETQSNSVHAYPRPLASFSIENEVQVLPNTTFNFINNSVGDNLYTWFFSTQSNIELGTSNEEDPRFTFPPMQQDEYIATLYVENEFGCTDSVSRKVEVVEDFLLFVPSAITANNDGVNDYFFIQGIDIDPSNFSLQIFNRWGVLVFETQDLNEKWNGSFSSNSQHNVEGTTYTNSYYTQNDLYFYRIETKSRSTGDKNNISGHITVIR